MVEKVTVGSLQRMRTMILDANIRINNQVSVIDNYDMLVLSFGDTTLEALSDTRECPI